MHCFNWHITQAKRASRELYDQVIQEGNSLSDLKRMNILNMLNDPDNYDIIMGTY